MSKKGLKASDDKGRRFSARPTTQESPEQQPPYFSLRYVSNRHCISDCQLQDRAAFADTIRKLSQLTWVEIKQRPRHALGYEKISRTSIIAGIPNNIKDDVQFIAFRFSGLKPMVGYRDGAVFHIVWFDDKFSLYSHS